jgi:hypothetical protein
LWRILSTPRPTQKFAEIPEMIVYFRRAAAAAARAQDALARREDGDFARLV